MPRKVLIIALCCMVLPYLYWHELVFHFATGHSINHYIKTYASPYLSSFGQSTVNDSEDPMGLEDEWSPFDDGSEIPDEENISSVLEQVISAGDGVTPEIQQLTSLYDNPSDRYPSQTGESFDLTVDTEVEFDDNLNLMDSQSEIASNNRNPPLKKILFWNKLRSRYKKNFGLGEGRLAFQKLGCPINTCTVTNKRHLYSYDELDAVVWHERSRDGSFPPRRSPHTRYIFMLAEPPGHVRKNLKKYHNVFNWTLTYRWDSDIPMRIGQILARKYPLPDNSHINYAAGKTKMAAWFVSNCGTDSGRGKVAKQLKKYFDVDVYGKCGPLNCPRFTKVDCLRKVEGRYKFYLSFENSLCKDYVTEKFFKVLLYDVVPVVYGGANYSAIAPEKSYINVRDFPSIEALANYLLYLNSNDTAYNEYFWWKRYYTVLAVGSSKALAWCQLCARLHTDNSIQTYPDLHDWYIKQARCQTRKYRSVKRFISG